MDSENNIPTTALSTVYMSFKKSFRRSALSSCSDGPAVLHGDQRFVVTSGRGFFRNSSLACSGECGFSVRSVNPIIASDLKMASGHGPCSYNLYISQY